MGIEQGIEQGEERAAQKIALNLLRENVPLEIISRTTGLMLAQLQQLQSSQNNS